MKKFIANILILIAIACAGVLVAWCADHSDETEAFSAQQEAVKAFYAALASGDWEGAGAVCDSSTMNDYIARFRKIWNSAGKDTAALNIAKSKLAEAELTFVEQNMLSEDSGSAVFTISAGEELEKTKMAELRQTQEGRWIITDIIAAK